MSEVLKGLDIAYMNSKVFFSSDEFTKEFAKYKILRGTYASMEYKFPLNEYKTMNLVCKLKYNYTEYGLEVPHVRFARVGIVEMINEVSVSGYLDLLDIAISELKTLCLSNRIARYKDIVISCFNFGMYNYIIGVCGNRMEFIMTLQHVIGFPRRVRKRRGYVDFKFDCGFCLTIDMSNYTCSLRSI